MYVLILLSIQSNKCLVTCHGTPNPSPPRHLFAGQVHSRATTKLCFNCAPHSLMTHFRTENVLSFWASAMRSETRITVCGPITCQWKNVIPTLENNGGVNTIDLHVCRSNKSVCNDVTIGICIPAFASHRSSTDYNVPRPILVQFGEFRVRHQSL
jgi:hypothetical protein